jgi:hypothetical protein
VQGLYKRLQWRLPWQEVLPPTHSATGMIYGMMPLVVNASPMPRNQTTEASAPPPQSKPQRLPPRPCPPGLKTTPLPHLIEPPVPHALFQFILHGSAVPGAHHPVPGNSSRRHHVNASNVLQHNQPKVTVSVHNNLHCKRHSAVNGLAQTHTLHSGVRRPAFMTVIRCPPALPRTRTCL